MSHRACASVRPLAHTPSLTNDSLARVRVWGFANKCSLDVARVGVEVCRACVDAECAKRWQLFQGSGPCGVWTSRQPPAAPGPIMNGARIVVMGCVRAHRQGAPCLADRPGLHRGRRPVRRPVRRCLRWPPAPPCGGQLQVLSCACSLRGRRGRVLCVCQSRAALSGSPVRGCASQVRGALTGAARKRSPCRVCQGAAPRAAATRLRLSIKLQ